jgi:hypothetical protein
MSHRTRVVPRIVVAAGLPDPALALLCEAVNVWLSPHERPLEPAERQARGRRCRRGGDPPP